MADTTITGNLASDPELRTTQTGRPVCNFTVVENRRRRNAAGAWEDDEPLFMRCTAWGELAEHVAASVSKGDRVTVSGRLTPHSYEDKDTGKRRTTVDLQSDDVAASLRFSDVQVRRIPRGSTRPESAPVADPWASESIPVGPEPVSI